MPVNRRSLRWNLESLRDYLEEWHEHSAMCVPEPGERDRNVRCPLDEIATALAILELLGWPELPEESVS